MDSTGTSSIMAHTIISFHSSLATETASQILEGLRIKMFNLLSMVKSTSKIIIIIIIITVFHYTIFDICFQQTSQEFS